MRKSIFDAAALKAVADGEADVAIWAISSANGPGTELAGVLPAQAKKFNSYASGILTNSDQVQAAKALLLFLSSATSLAVMKSKGFNPPWNASPMSAFGGKVDISVKRVYFRF